jgi:hypothetical protein
MTFFQAELVSVLIGLVMGIVKARLGSRERQLVAFAHALAIFGCVVFVKGIGDFISVSALTHMLLLWLVSMIGMAITYFGYFAYMRRKH